MKTKHHYFEPTLWHQGKKTNIVLAIIITACICMHVYKRQQPKIIQPTARLMPSDLRDAVANTVVIEANQDKLIIRKRVQNEHKATQEPMKGPTRQGSIE